MNTPIVNDSFRFVKWLFGEFLPKGYQDMELEQAIELKNNCVILGRRKGLKDQDLEILSLAALFHNAGCIERQYDTRVVSKTIARKFLLEQYFTVPKVKLVLSCIDATLEGYQPTSILEKLIREVKFHQIKKRSNRKNISTVGDVWP